MSSRVARQSTQVSIGVLTEIPARSTCGGADRRRCPTTPRRRRALPERVVTWRGASCDSSAAGSGNPHRMAAVTWLKNAPSGSAGSSARQRSTTRSLTPRGGPVSRCQRRMPWNGRSHSTRRRAAGVSPRASASRTRKASASSFTPPIMPARALRLLCCAPTLWRTRETSNSTGAGRGSWSFLRSHGDA